MLQLSHKYSPIEGQGGVYIMMTDVLFETGRGEAIRPGVFGGHSYKFVSKLNPGGECRLSAPIAQAIISLTTDKPRVFYAEDGIIVRINKKDSAKALVDDDGNVTQILYTNSKSAIKAAVISILAVCGNLEDPEINDFLVDSTPQYKLIRAADAAFQLIKSIWHEMTNGSLSHVVEIPLLPEEMTDSFKEEVVEKSSSETFEVASVKMADGSNAIKTSLVTDLVDMVKNGAKHLLIYGPAGTGKSVAARMAAEELGYKDNEIFTDSLNGDLESSHFTGGHEPTEDWYAFRESKLVEAAKKGGCYIVNEINFVKSRSVGAFHEVMAPVGGMAALPNGEYVKIADRFMIIATMNPNYAGTVDLNDAFIDRFDRLIEVTEFPIDILKKLLAEKLQSFEKRDILILKMIDIYTELRRFIEQEGNGFLIGVRRMLAWANEIKRTKDFLRAAETTIIPAVCRKPAGGDPEIERFVRDVIMKLKVGAL